MSSFIFKKNYSDGINRNNDPVNSSKVLLETKVFNAFKERVLSGNLKGEIRTDGLWRILYPGFDEYYNRSIKIDSDNAALLITDAEFDPNTQELVVEVSPIGEFKESIEKGFKEGSMGIGMRCFTLKYSDHYKIHEIITFDLVHSE